MTNLERAVSEPKRVAAEGSFNVWSNYYFCPNLCRTCQYFYTENSNWPYHCKGPSTTAASHISKKEGFKQYDHCRCYKEKSDSIKENEQSLLKTLLSKNEPSPANDSEEKINTTAKEAKRIGRCIGCHRDIYEEDSCSTLYGYFVCDECKEKEDVSEKCRNLYEKHQEHLKYLESPKGRAKSCLEEMKSCDFFTEDELSETKQKLAVFVEENKIDEINQFSEKFKIEKQKRVDEQKEIFSKMKQEVDSFRLENQNFFIADDWKKIDEYLDSFLSLKDESAENNIFLDEMLQNENYSSFILNRRCEKISEENLNRIKEITQQKYKNIRKRKTLGNILYWILYVPCYLCILCGCFATAIMMPENFPKPAKPILIVVTILMVLIPLIRKLHKNGVKVENYEKIKELVEKEN